MITMTMTVQNIYLRDSNGAVSDWHGKVFGGGGGNSYDNSIGGIFNGCRNIRELNNNVCYY